MLKVDSVSYAYNNTTVLEDISFTLRHGEHLAVMGESGSGKSTLLKAVYGLFDLPEGTISFNKKQVLGPAYQLIPGHEKMKYLAQDFGLMPYHTVAENVGKHLSNIYIQKKKQRIDELLHLVGMQTYANQKPFLLSGGEKQRVALAVTLAKAPELLILDEPFSQIDHFRKNELQTEIFAYLKSKNIGCLVATHDSKEALAFADNILILKNGKVIAYDSAEKIYTQHHDFYIASLFGRVSWFTDENGNKKLLKPHQIAVSKKSHYQAIVTHCYFQGERYLIQTTMNTEKIYFFHQNSLEIGEKVYLSERK